MDEPKVSIELIEEKKRKWDEYKEHAEQHEFIKIIAIDLWIERMYEDIKMNWDEEHAKILMQYFDRAFQYAEIIKGDF